MIVKDIYAVNCSEVTSTASVGVGRQNTGTGNVHNQVTKNVLKNNIHENTQYIIHGQ